MADAHGTQAHEDQGQRQEDQEEDQRPLQEQVDCVDYKDVNLLRRFMSDRAKIRARRVTGNDTQQQREVARAIKNAREMALLPYASRVTTQRTAVATVAIVATAVDRGDRGDRGSASPRPTAPTPATEAAGDRRSRPPS